jgi:hypothetical protein
LIPTTTQADALQPDSLPFLLVRPSRPSLAMKSDVLDDDGETTEIPASKSVPPHLPPAPVVTTEHELPSVIVSLFDLEIGESAELQRASDVDGLLTAVEVIEVTIPLEEVTIPVEVAPSIDPTSDTGRVIVRSAPRARSRGFAIAALAALMAAGGTFAGLKVCHVSGGSLGAALHVVR